MTCNFLVTEEFSCKGICTICELMHLDCSNKCDLEMLIRKSHVLLLDVEDLGCFDVCHCEG
jgi:hypothetical protein